MAQNDMVGEIFGWVGLVLAIYFYLAPFAPFKDLIQGKIKYNETPGPTLICSQMNCLLWLIYGLRLNRSQVIYANLIGAVITLIWIIIYLIFRAEKQIGKSLLFNLFLFIIMAIISYIGLLLMKVETVGTSAMIFNILMYAAPGVALFYVCKTGDYNKLPIFSSIGGLLCSSCWCIYGLYLRDRNLIVPNGIGMVNAVIQVSTYLYFYCKKKEKKSNDDKDVELKDEEQE